MHTSDVDKRGGWMDVPNQEEEMGGGMYRVLLADAADALWGICHTPTIPRTN